MNSVVANRVMAGRTRVRRDYRPLSVFVVFLFVGLVGWGVSRIPGQGIEARVEEERPAAAEPVELPFSGLQEMTSPSARDVVESIAADRKSQKEENTPESRAKRLMAKAEQGIKEKRYDEAIWMLHEARAELKQYPEAYVLIGRALEGKGDYETAREFYNAAIDLNPYLPKAYWGYATTSEALGDLESAIGGMRSFLHTEPNLDPNRLSVAQARSAIWEWESKLGRGLWGPTKGIPPGFTEDELKRDGRGVAIKMPLLETKQPDGSMKYEIKHADKFEIFDPD